MPIRIDSAGSSFVGQARRFPFWTDVVALADSNPVGYLVPAGAQFVEIRPVKADGSAQLVFCNLNGNAAPPNLNTLNGSASFPLGDRTSYIVDGGETISFVRTGLATVFVVIVVYRA